MDPQLPSRPDDLAGAGAPIPRHLGLARVVIAAAQLMIVLDAALVNVALPEIQRALGFSGEMPKGAGGTSGLPPPGTRR